MFAAKTDTVAVTSTKQRKKKNYALQECGAKILASNPEGTNVKSVLNPNKDDYMINPCKVKKWSVFINHCLPLRMFCLLNYCLALRMFCLLSHCLTLRMF